MGSKDFVAFVGEALEAGYCIWMCLFFMTVSPFSLL